MTTTKESDFALEFYGEGLRREKALLEAESEVKWHESDVVRYLHAWVVTALYHDPKDMRTLLRVTDMYARRMAAEERSGEGDVEGRVERMAAMMAELGETECPYRHGEDGQEVGSPFWTGDRGEWHFTP